MWHRTSCSLSAPYDWPLSPLAVSLTMNSINCLASTDWTRFHYTSSQSGNVTAERRSVGTSAMSSDMRTVNSIVIVGGGSSGWMTATYLSKLLFDVDITLIESPTMPVIGVGEATIPFIRSYMSRIGLPDD